VLKSESATDETVLSLLPLFQGCLPLKLLTVELASGLLALGRELPLAVAGLLIVLGRVSLEGAPAAPTPAAGRVAAGATSLLRPMLDAIGHSLFTCSRRRIKNNLLTCFWVYGIDTQKNGIFTQTLYIFLKR